jgi:NIMA (never in mitosis gene a)-related kinase
LDHPFIIRYHESFPHESGVCIVMDYATDGDLARLIRRHKQAGTSFDPSQVLSWLTQIVLALAHMH